MVNRRSIVFYLPYLAGGGIERVKLRIAPHLMKAGYDVTFLLQTRGGELENSVPSGARVVVLNVVRTLFAFFPLVRFLRKEKPDIFFSSFGHNNILTLWAGLFAPKKAAIVISQHNALSAETVRGRGLRFSALLPFLYRLFLRFSDAVVAVSVGIGDEMARLAHFPRDRISVIYNPIVSEAFDRKRTEPCAHPWLQSGQPPVFIAVGRLVEVKGFSTLIDAFAKLSRTKDVRLVLLGEGHLRSSLEAQVAALGLKDRVALLGFQLNPLPFVQRAAALVMSSTNEGFGNVLVEALACGTPVVSTDCPYGPCEILDGGKYGALVPVGDSEALARAMGEVLERPLAGEVLKQRGREFTVEKSVARYLELFDSLIASKERSSGRSMM